MALDNNSINIEILADTGRAEVSLQQFQNTLQSFTNNYNQSFQNFSNNYIRTTNNILQISENAQQGFSRLVTSIADLGFAFSHFKAIVSSVAKSYMAFTDTLSKMSQRTGIAAESLGGLKFAAEQSGANFDILSQGLRTFQQQLANAQNGKNTLGIDATTDTEEALMQFADRIKNMTSETQQVKAATEAFGKAGYKLLPMLQEGRAGIQKLKDEARELGLTLDETAIQEGVKLTDATNRMQQSFASVSNQIISALAPSMTTLFDNMARVASSITSWISSCPVFVSNLGNITIAIGAVVGVLQLLPAILSAIVAHPVVAVIAGLAVAVAGLSAAMGPVPEQFNALTNSMQKQREQVDELISVDKARIERLKELQQISDEGSLNNDEVEEATTLVAELTNRYGDLGIEIDETTGKIYGMTNATKKMYERMSADRRAALEKERIEASANLKSLDARERNLRAREDSIWTGYNFFDRLTGKEKEEEDEIEVERQRNQNKIYIIDRQLNSLDAGVSDIGAENPDQKSPTQIKKEAAAARRLATLNESAANYGKSKTELELANIDKETNEYKAAYKAKYGSLPSMSREWYEQNKDKLPEDLTLGKSASVAYFRFMDVQSQKRKDVEKKAAEQTAKERQDAAAKAKDEAQKRAEIEKLGVDNRPASVIEAQKRVDDLQDSISAKRIGAKTDDNRSIKALQAELDKAKLDLAKTIAKTSGQARVEARKKYESELASFDDMKKFSSLHSVDEMKAQWERVEKAKAEMDKQNNEYNSAVGTIQAAQEERANNQISAAKQQIDSATTQGTFSAWETGSIGNSTAKEQLITMKKMLDELIGINKNTEEGVVTA